MRDAPEDVPLGDAWAPGRESQGGVGLSRCVSGCVPLHIETIPYHFSRTNLLT